MKPVRLKERQLGERVRSYEGLAVATDGRGAAVRLRALGFALSGDPRSVSVILQRFPLGRIAVTEAADEAVSLAECLEALLRHATGDFGDVEPAAVAGNERAIDEGGQILSAYRTEAGRRFWLLTEGDRSRTTILMAGDRD
jgi:hypothetical protein